jgi:glutathione S-transferase
MTTGLRLITIPISHYCEKARWALDWAHLPFVEEAHLQVFHYVPAWRAGRSRTVPVLVHPGGALTDSADILRWVDDQLPIERKLFPRDPLELAEVNRLNAWFDTELGPSGRLWMYHQLLNEPPEIAHTYGCTGIPAWQKRLFLPAFPVIKVFLQWLIGTNPTAAAEATNQYQRVLDDVAERISDGRKYLVGTTFSAADLTFASLCAPLLMTPEYGVPLPRVEELPAAFAQVVTSCRAHPAGQFALDLYKRHRHFS